MGRDARRRRPYRLTPDELAAWTAKTDAPVGDADALRTWLSATERTAIGVMGYAGDWSRGGLEGDALAATVDAARRALQDALFDAAARCVELVMVSGGTDAGVLELAYEQSAVLGIPTVALTTARGLEYPLATVDRVAVAGRDFGDESEAFVSICDIFLVLGGGEQSKREAIMALRRGKPVTAIRGFGGAADVLEDHPCLSCVEVALARSEPA